MAVSASSSSSSSSLYFRTLTRVSHSNLLPIQHQPTITGHHLSKSLNLFKLKKSRNPNLHFINSIEKRKEENTNQFSIESESETEKSLDETGSGSDSIDGLGSEMKEAMKAKKERENEEDKVLGGNLMWSGIAEEVGMIEWPAFSKVVGTTGVVLGVMIGSSVVLLTVNAVLAEISDQVFVGRGVQDFFG